jgi:hypothetical protein
MKLLTGLFRACRKRLLTNDNDMGMFRNKLNELVDNKDSLSDEEVVSCVEELKKITDDLPDGEDKEKLVRFLEDFKIVKQQDEKTAKEAASSVADLFERLDTKSMQDVPENVAVEEKETPLTEETSSAESENVNEITEETKAPEEKEGTEDKDANAKYTLEEIYQFIKKRMAEDAGKEEAEEDTEEAEDNACTQKEENKDDVVADHAPHIPVTVKDHVAGGNLRALFNMAKGE